jgi:hypothetical protein
LKNVVKKQSTDYERVAVSWHESSHTIVGLLNHFIINKVFITLDKEQEGVSVGDAETQYHRVLFDDDKEFNQYLLICELQMIYAGLMGEKIYYKDICGSSKFPMHLRIGSYVDIANASDLIRKNNLASPGKSTYALKKKIQKDVENLLLDNWEAVKMVAHSLYQKKKLSFDELKYILTRKTSNKEFWKKRFSEIKFIYHDKNPPAEDEVRKIILNA